MYRPVIRPISTHSSLKRKKKNKKKKPKKKQKKKQDKTKQNKTKKQKKKIWSTQNIYELSNQKSVNESVR